MRLIERYNRCMKKKGLSKQALSAAVVLLLAAGGGYGGYVLVEKGRAFEKAVHTVAHVVDGDTIDLASGERVRLLGVDAPEIGTCHFEEAKNALKKKLEGKQVRVEKDISGVDRYGRLLRYVHVLSSDPQKDDVLVNESLLREGYAYTLAVAPDNRYRDLFASAQRSAKDTDRGLWHECPATAPDDDLREEDSVAPSRSCTIKGNISEKGYGKNYFLEGCPNYARIKVDPRKGEQWFCTEAQARKAGFEKSASCANAFP